jgi:DNA-binding response OmpR family regulator
MDAILVVDKDVEFGKDITDAATHLKIPVAVCTSLDELRTLEGIHFAAAVVDYDLDSSAGLSYSRQIERFVGHVPIIMVGASDEIAADAAWPDSAKAFIPKSAGLKRILDAAMAAHQLSLDTEG